MVMVLVISGHFGLLVLLLRPAIPDQDAVSVVGHNAPMLELRLLPPPRPPARLPPTGTPSGRAGRVRLRDAIGKLLRPPAIGGATHVDRQPQGTRSTHEAVVTTVPDPDAGGGKSTRSGGFLERLYEAQRPRPVRGVPGSNMSFVPGIHLVDPMRQGIGGVMRTAQHGFGIENSHCMDVDVWRHLTPQELSARHISPGDVAEMDKKYRCNDPPGFHF